MGRQQDQGERAESANRLHLKDLVYEQRGRRQGETVFGTRTLQPLGTRKLRELAIESPKRQVPGLPGDLEKQAIGEADSRAPSKLFRRDRDYVRVLDRKAFMGKQDLYRRDHGWSPVVIRGPSA